jgi:hypothetical protein
MKTATLDVGGTLALRKIAQDEAVPEWSKFSPACPRRYTDVVRYEGRAATALGLILGTRKINFVLIGRSDGYRPRAAARTTDKIWCTIRRVPGGGDVFQANRQVKARQSRSPAKSRRSPISLRHKSIRMSGHPAMTPAGTWVDWKSGVIVHGAELYV